MSAHLHFAATLLFAAIAGAQSEALTKAGETSAGMVTAGNPATHRVKLSEKQFFYAQVNGIRMTLELVDPVGRATGPAARTAAAIIQQAGEYQLRVRTLAPSTQRYTLTINLWRESRQDDTIRLEAIRILTEGYTAVEMATADSRQTGVRHYRNARQIAASINDTWLEARCLLAESMVHSALGAVQQALAAMNDAIRVYSTRGDRGGEAYVLNMAALLHAQRSEHKTAFEYYQRALGYYREKGDRLREAEVLRNMAIAHASAGNLQTAIETYLAVLQRFRAIPDSYNEAVTLVQLSDFHLNLGDYGQAIAIAQQALPMHRGHLDKTAEVHTLTNIGEAYAGQGNHAEALKYFKEAVEIARQAGLGWLHVNTQALAGASHEALGQLDRAEALYLEALHPMEAHGNRDGASRLRTRLGLLDLKGGRIGEASAHLAEAHALAQGIANGIAEAYALTALARLARAKKKPEVALAHCRQALAIIEKTRTRVDDKSLRATFLASRASSYELYIDLLMERNDIAGAFEGLERFRARSLLDLLGQNNQSAPADSPVSSDRSIDADTAILEYHFGEQRSWLFILTKEAVRAKPLPGAAALDPKIRQLRGLLTQPGRATLGRYVQAANELYRECVKPAMEGIAGKRRLVIVADGPLHYLPFEALLTGEPEHLVYDRLPYLLNRWNVSYAPSTAAFVSLQRIATRGEGHDLIAFGDPKGDLSGAAEEIREIARAFPAARTLLFMGNRVTKDAVTQSRALPRARRVHFATHGRLTEGSSATTGVLLAGDALLSTAEVLRFRWNAELVVLSACQTGLGPRLRGEGILGLTRAFHFAGVSSVAVSLWPVSDRSTVSLMTNFYQRIRQGERNSQALREAKLALIRSTTYAHPYYWAPFVLSGRL